MRSALSPETISEAPSRPVWATSLRCNGCTCAALNSRHFTSLRRPACDLSSLSGNQLSGTIPSSFDMTALLGLCVRLTTFWHCTDNVLTRPTYALSDLSNNQLIGFPSSMNTPALQHLCVPCAEGGF